MAKDQETTEQQQQQTGTQQQASGGNNSLLGVLSALRLMSLVNKLRQYEAANQMLQAGVDYNSGYLGSGVNGGQLALSSNGVMVEVMADGTVVPVDAVGSTVTPTGEAAYIMADGSTMTASEVGATPVGSAVTESGQAGTLMSDGTVVASSGSGGGYGSMAASQGWGGQAVQNAGIGYAAHNSFNEYGDARTNDSDENVTEAIGAAGGGIAGGIVGGIFGGPYGAGVGAAFGSEAGNKLSQWDPWDDEFLGWARQNIPLVEEKLQFMLDPFGSGKGKDQKRRDSVRDFLRDAEFIYDDGGMDYLDVQGQPFAIGKDGGEPYYQIGYGRDDFVGWDAGKDALNDYLNANFQHEIAAMNPVVQAMLGSEADQKIHADFVGYLVNAADSTGDRVGGMQDVIGQVAGGGLDGRNRLYEQVLANDELNWDVKNAYLAEIDKLYGVINPYASEEDTRRQMGSPYFSMMNNWNPQTDGTWAFGGELPPRTSGSGSSQQSKPKPEPEPQQEQELNLFPTVPVGDGKKPKPKPKPLTQTHENIIDMLYGRR